MRRKGLVTLGLIATMSLSLSIISHAGEWKRDTTGWWWQNDDGSYPANKWEWLDGNKDGTAECYYFNGSGYCLMGTTTPDNYTVNENGAWTVNGVVQTQSNNQSGSVYLVDLSQFFNTDLKYRDNLAAFCGESPDDLQREINFGNIIENDLSLYHRTNPEQYPYYFYFDHIKGTEFATELSYIESRISNYTDPVNGGMRTFIKGLDPNKKYTPSDMEVIVRGLGAKNIKKTEEVERKEVIGSFGGGALGATGEYYNAYNSRLEFDYNGVRYTFWGYASSKYLDGGQVSAIK